MTLHGHRASALAVLRRRSRALLAAVLPALLLRALIPFGFMPVAGSGGPTMELCPGAMVMASTGHAHEHHHHAGSGTAAPAAHTLCLFAASAAPALAPVVLATPAPAAPAAAAADVPVDSIRLSSILRAQTARAPPAFS